MTIDELKREAKSHGYKLIPISPYEPKDCWLDWLKRKEE